MGASEGFGNLYFFADAVNKGFRGEGANDAGGADDGYAARDAEAGVECLGSEFCTAGDEDTDVDAGSDFMMMNHAFHFPDHHGTGSGS